MEDNVVPQKCVYLSSEGSSVVSTQTPCSREPFSLLSCTGNSVEYMLRVRASVGLKRASLLVTVAQGAEL